ncbi:DIA1R protein, partial [Polypterus senegalus]
MDFVPWKANRLTLRALLSVWVGLSLSCWRAQASVATAESSAQRKSAYNFSKPFLGLDKCNACIGTSICKKFFKEEIRFENWLSSNLKLPSSYKVSYAGNYTDDSENWRVIVISRLLPQYKHDLSDTRICSSAHRSTCSIESVLKSTERFQKWLGSNLLTPELVQGLSSPMLRCPSQRLLNRIIRRYAEVADAGSIQMNHFREQDKLRLLYTLSINQHPIILQIFPGKEGWPFPRYHGSCGRMMVTAGTEPLRRYYGAPLETVADLAYQLLHITEFLRENGLSYLLYYTAVSADMFGTFEDGRLFITDASTIGVIDKQEGSWMPVLSASDTRLGPNLDVGPVRANALSNTHTCDVNVELAVDVTNTFETPLSLEGAVLLLMTHERGMAGLIALVCEQAIPQVLPLSTPEPLGFQHSTAHTYTHKV